ncbi:protoporphyrinogen oxidase [Rossellomorea aquimaris]|uniref:protoporphyrinogen oxidase n=1 Tax=Rossellomorea aquimaris TaxID=189382 RepID=UPI001CD1F723|nr:protoporphyrinogen oxidase [Rossellomorea aquimaris]MCA1053724.1 protoporphyrinogen oxidase [Rossellomorea aquimaris]
MKKVVVVGGGVTGLATMYYLDKLRREKHIDLELTLVEREEVLGGKIKTVKNSPFIMEAGADSIVARNEGVLPFVEELKLEGDLVYNQTGISYIYTNGKLHEIPADTIFGIPMSIESLMQSTLVSEKGKQAAMQDLELPNTHFTKDDSVGDFLEAFLGRELVENQIAPVLSGVYSGKLHELTLSTTLPYLLEYKDRYGSIIKGLEANKDKFKSSSKGKFISFRGGLSTLIHRMEDMMEDVRVLKGKETVALRKNGGSYELTLSDDHKLDADYIVFSTTHDVTQKIMNDTNLDAYFDQFKNTSLTSIYIGFDVKDDLLPADGTGFITSHGSDVICNACTWTSRKWKHTSESNELLVRLFYKSSNPHYDLIAGRNEEELIKIALKDVSKSLGIKEEPLTVEVTTWNDLMPNYHLQHSQAVDSIMTALHEDYPNVLLAGASYYGVGIGACIKNGKQTAENIIESISG